MKISLRTSSLFAAILCWALLSALVVFIVLSLRDRARLIRDNDNERLFNLLFSSLRDYEDFGSAIESSQLLRERIIGLAIYGEDLVPLYQWGKVPPQFDETILQNRPAKNGRYTIPDRRGSSIQFIISTERRMPPPPPASPPPPQMPPQMRGQQNSRERTDIWWRRETNKSGENGQERAARGFFAAFALSRYTYIDVSHPSYWRNQTLTAIAFPLCSLALLALALFVRELYLRNREYRERIEGQKNLVVLGTAASTLAHEIKNPLLSIRLQTSILEKIVPGRGTEELGIINEEVDRLSALSYRINDYLRDAAGQPGPLKIASVLSEISIRLCGRNIVEENSDRDALVFMDSERMRSVFENIIRNALESGSVENGIGASILRHSGSSGESGIVVVSIYDRGRGIAEGDLKRVFDPFFTSKSAGTGVGLSISKRFVEAAGGTIDIAGREGGGTVVSVTLGEYRKKPMGETA
ncbi:MAG: sensor histidine kinase [Treponema sp.]|jgi:two-component system sensor histidine kinase HydH|nr:sensor histidine kinase [Treponema sp.]